MGIADEIRRIQAPVCQNTKNEKGRSLLETGLHVDSVYQLQILRFPLFHRMINGAG
jgi:hypothetical protein